jgi:hypothetical protein
VESRADPRDLADHGAALLYNSRTRPILPPLSMTDADVSVPIEGAWQLESYSRGDVSTAVAGVLLLTSGQWSTLYFVPQANSGQYWGSGESGRYTARSNRLTFYHRYTFQGGGDRPIVTNLDSQVVEECRIEVSKDQLTIYFPSGSIIRCRRHQE